MIVDQDAHPPHHLPSRSRHGSGTACHDRQALVPPWAPLAHALAHSRGDGHQAQPEGLETIPSRSAQGWHLPREARSRLERSVEASIDHVSRAAVCHMPGSALAATARDQTSGGGAKYGKVPKGSSFGFITKNRCSQPSFCTVGGKRQSGHINPATPVRVHAFEAPRSTQNQKNINYTDQNIHQNDPKCPPRRGPQQNNLRPASQ